MKILNFGSLNIDHVYEVPHFVQPGETLASEQYQRFVGGKGLNQSIALAKAGTQVAHAGLIGEDGAQLKQTLEQAGANVEHVSVCEQPSGHAIIQVNQQGENCIILFGGANQAITSEHVDQVLVNLQAEDIVLLQNEINEMPYIMQQAKERGCTLVLNPAPMSEAVLNYPLELVDIFIINETEGAGLTGVENPSEIMRIMSQRFPNAITVLTLGADGVYVYSQQEQFNLPALKVTAVDTTGAGDTFIGYFLAALTQKKLLRAAIELAIKASAICVTRKGAAASIPSPEELQVAQL